MAPAIAKEEPVPETPAPRSDNGERGGDPTYAPRGTDDDYVAPPVRTQTAPPGAQDDDGRGDGDRGQEVRICSIRCWSRQQTLPLEVLIVRNPAWARIPVLLLFTGVRYYCSISL